MNYAFKVGDVVVDRLFGGRFKVMATRDQPWRTNQGIDRYPEPGLDYLLVGPESTGHNGDLLYLGTRSVREDQIRAVDESSKSSSGSGLGVLERESRMSERDDIQEIIAFLPSHERANPFDDVRSALENSGVPLDVQRPHPNLGPRAVCQVLYSTSLFHRRKIIGIMEGFGLECRDRTP